MDEKELIEFAKWLIHSRRKTFTYQQHVNAHDFASNLMTELCHIEPFVSEHKLMTEYKEYKKQNVN